MSLDPRYLRQLAEIIDNGSMTKAALILNVPQSTLSRNMKSLEAHIGVPLFERGRYGIIPTRVGVSFAREGRKIAHSLKQAETEYQRWRSGLDGTLRVGVGTMLAHSLMAIFLDHPLTTKWRIALLLSVEGIGRLLDQVQRDELDLAITLGDALDAPSGLKRHVLFEETIGFYVAPTHSLAMRRSVSLGELSHAEFLAVGTIFQNVAEVFRSAKLEVNAPRLSFSGDVAMALHLLARGRHVAVLPDTLMGNICDGRKYVRLQLKMDFPHRIIAAWHRKDMEGHPLVSEFLRRYNYFLQERQKLRS